MDKNKAAEGYAFSDALRLVKDVYPFMEPQAYIAYRNIYIFNLSNQIDDPKTAIANFCFVDPAKSKVSPCVSSMMMYQDQSFRDLWKSAIIIKKIKHGLLEYGSGALAHYGIKGQHWGVQNGPPYPLDQKTHDEIVKRKEAYDAHKGTVVRGTRMVRDAFEQIEKRSSLTDEEKQARKDKVNRANEALSIKLLSDISTNRVFSEQNPPKMIHGRHTMDDDLARVNPRWDPGEDGEDPSPTGNNCGLCAFAYDLRRRGYDVIAKCSVDGINPRRLMKDVYQDAKMDVVMADSFSDLVKDFDTNVYPNGSRGIMCLVGKNGSDGHAINFEVYKNKIHMLDAQGNDVHYGKELDAFEEYTPEYIEMIRTDNLKVNYNQLHKVVNETRDGWEKTMNRENPLWSRKCHGVEPSIDELCRMLGVDLRD